MLIHMLWIAGILALWGLGLVLWIWIRKRCADDGELRQRAGVLIGLLMSLGIVPWLAMACGPLFGEIDDIVFYLNPSAGSPYVVGFYLSIVFHWVVGGYWLLGLSGAETVSDLIALTGLWAIGESKVRGLVIAYLVLGSLVILGLVLFGNRIQVIFNSG